MTFGGKVVHDGVDLAVREGEIMTLVGGSGQGKTVLLKEIIGLMRPDSGEIFVHGREVTRMDSFELQEVRREAAMVFQGSALFDSMTVADNVAYGVLERYPGMPRDQWMKIVAEKLGLVDMPGHRSADAGGTERRHEEARRARPGAGARAEDHPLRRADHRPGPRERPPHQRAHRQDAAGVPRHEHHGHARPPGHRGRSPTAWPCWTAGRIIAVGTWKEMEACTTPRVCQFLAGEVEA